MDEFVLTTSNSVNSWIHRRRARPLNYGGARTGIWTVGGSGLGHNVRGLGHNVPGLIPSLSALITKLNNRVHLQRKFLLGTHGLFRKQTTLVQCRDSYKQDHLLLYQTIRSWLHVHAKEDYLIWSSHAEQISLYSGQIRSDPIKMSVRGL